MAKVAINTATKTKWHSLNVSPKELRLDVTLTNGQCFNWKKYPLLKNELSNLSSPQLPQYFGVLGNRVFLLKQTKDDVHYRVLNEEQLICDYGRKYGIKMNNVKDNNTYVPSTLITKFTKESEDILYDYFQLDTNLEQLYKEWSEKADSSFIDISKSLYGMRILRQDPIECLFSFLCSSCNNIIRITQMLDKLRKEYGVLLYEDNARDVKCYSFPTLQAFDEIATEERLRELGMGYRAVFIKESARELNQPIQMSLNYNNNSNHACNTDKDDNDVTICEYKSGVEYLHSLRKLDRLKVKEELTFKIDKKKLKASGVDNVTRRGLAGVGPKVADCIALFSLDQVGCVPVDTHVIQIAARDFDPSLRNVSLTKSVHERVGNLFRECYGPYAGWAHSLLFAAELPQFEGKLPKHVVTYIKKFKDLCKKQNALKKLERKKLKANAAGAAKTKRKKVNNDGQDNSDRKKKKKD